MFRIIVAALFGNLGNTVGSAGQKVTGFEDPEADYVIHA